MSVRNRTWAVVGSLAFVTVVLVVLAACGGDDKAEEEPGATASVPGATAPPGGEVLKATLEIGATDAPPKDVTAILITVSNIQVQASGTEPWLTVVPGPVQFDLVEIQGVEQKLGEAQLDPGRYGQIRLDIEKAEVTVQGNTVDARVPSDKLRIVGGFELEAGQTTSLTLDFDAAKSVVVAGPRNVLIKPVVKLLVRKGSDDLASSKPIGQVDESASDDDGGGGEEGAAADAKSTVTVSDDPELGAILVDGDGFTLYVLTRDEPDVSTCTGGCARSWPPLIAPGDQAPLAGEGVEPGLLGTFTREDGSKQVTYGRQPLYNFSGDREAGSTRGQGVSQVWFTISPAGEPITE